MATVSSVISSVKSWVSNNLSKYLPLGGGKMTGNITYVHTGLSIGTNPTSTQYKAIHWTDKTGDTGNNNRLATVEYSCNASGTAGIVIGPYQYVANRGSYTGSLLAMNVSSDGTKSISWDGKPVVCVTRWTSGTSWYRAYSDGWIEQGGKLSMPSTECTVTFHKAFADTNYMILGASAGSTNTLNVEFKNKTTSSVVFDFSGTNTGNFYWYACGCGY